ncbi:MAG: DNA-3-methyladenine glycosylase I [Alphaproteobacteria bacterium]
MSTHYCDYAPHDPVHAAYHETEYGWPESDESRLFERLVLEINQAGLNWGLMLKKREGFRNAFDNYDIDRIAKYGDADRNRLLNDEGIIRNRLKVNAAIHNAQVVRSFRDSHGGFAAWIDAHHPLTKSEWVKLFKKTFKFTGGEITGEFLMSIGYLPGTHRKDCPVYANIAKLQPAWMNPGLKFYS